MSKFKKTYRVAVVGATGLVGRELLAVLHERGFPLDSVVALASAASVGEAVSFGDTELIIQEATPQALTGIDLVLMSAGQEVSAVLAPAATASGAVVIDNSAEWRGHPEVPLVVPEVNATDLAPLPTKRIIANPNCSTIQLAVALAPLHQYAGLRRVSLATYQAVSGAGQAGIDELGCAVEGLYAQREVPPQVFAKPIAFNCLPHIDQFLPDGFTREERKMRDETRKILHLPHLPLCATCVRVPVFNGHAIAVVAQFERPIATQEARDYLKQAPGILLQDDPEALEYPTNIDANGQDATLVGRVRQDPDDPHTLAFWCVADNVRKGAATNAVQIAEIIVRHGLNNV